MKNLTVSIFAVFMSLVLFWISPIINLLVIIVVSSFVLLWLLYQAQLLPEDIMAYLDNRIIHDGQQNTAVLSVDAYRDNQSIESNNSNSEEVIDEVLETEAISRIAPGEALLNLVREKSEELGVIVIPLDGLSSWLSEVDQSIAEREILLLIETMKQASGLSDSIKLNFFESSLEAHV